MNFETEFSVTRWTDYFVIYSNESSPMAYKIYQNSFKILPNTKYTLKILPKTLNILPKWTVQLTELADSDVYLFLLKCSMDRHSIDTVHKWFGLGQKLKSWTF